MENNKQVQQDNGKLSIYERVRNVPEEAKKANESGEMAVFVDINLFVKKDEEWSKPI